MAISSPTMVRTPPAITISPTKGCMLSLRSTRAEPHPCHAPHHTHHTHHHPAASLAALRAAIQQFVEANPSFQSELYQAQATRACEPEGVPNRSTSGEWAASVQSATPSEIATVMGMPMDTPVATVTAERVAEGGASASAGPVVVLTEEDAVAAAAFAVADWSQLRRKPQAAASKKSIFGGGGAGSGSKLVPADGLDPADLAVRASVSGYGGAALQVELGSERGLLHLARMLAARCDTTSPIANFYPNPNPNPNPTSTRTRTRTRTRTLP